MSIREKIAARTRRRVVVPIELGQLPDEEQRRVVELQAAMLLAIRDGEKDRAEELQDDIDALKAQVVAEVQFQALEPGEFEKVTAAYPSAEGEDGGLDWHKALPVLAALCAIDEELQDDAWWAEQLTATFTHGEKLALWQALLHINTSTPNPYIPKG